ncbi:MAG: YjbR family protein, partial [uncultured Gemmatimonadetes bacterium]
EGRCAGKCRPVARGTPVRLPCATSAFRHDPGGHRTLEHRSLGPPASPLPGASRSHRAGGLGRTYLPRPQEDLRDVRGQPSPRRARGGVVSRPGRHSAAARPLRSRHLLRASLRGREGMDRHRHRRAGRRGAARADRPVVLHDRPEEAPGPGRRL